MKKVFGEGGVMTRTLKRNVIIVAAVLLIGVAVYLNYLWFYSPDDGSDYGNNNMVDANGTNTDDTPTGGEDDTDSVTTYFSSVELSRKQARDEAIEMLEAVVNSAETDSEAREQALKDISQIALNMETEANIESRILSKGFTQCIAVMGDEDIHIIVSCEGEMPATGTAQIAAAVYEECGILPENITITLKQ